jgi:ketopantoate reductase
MMVDRERGRSMEIDALIGVIVRKGREHGVPTPLSETLFALLTAIEAQAPSPGEQKWVPPPVS